ncbi:MAG: hypothetical protein ACJA09_001310 [Alcanivorax sp.]|jgi:hypothetical protein
MKQGRSSGKGVLMKPWSVPVYSCLFRTVERPESGEVVAFPLCRQSAPSLWENSSMKVVVKK